MRVIDFHMLTRERFYGHLAEFPTHRSQLPPGVEQEFVQDLNRGSYSPIAFLCFQLLTFDSID